MSIHRIILMGTALFLVAGCSEVEEPVAPVAGTTSMLLAGAQHRIMGSGHVEQGDGIREFTFHAVERPGEGVSGSYKVVLPNGLFFEADVTCLAVEDDTGWVAGIIRDTNAGDALLGTVSMFYAVDGGEGEGATDIVSSATFLGPEGSDQEFCADRPLELAQMTVTQGNVQVR